MSEKHLNKLRHGTQLTRRTPVRFIIQTATTPQPTYTNVRRSWNEHGAHGIPHWIYTPYHCSDPSCPRAYV